MFSDIYHLSFNVAEPPKELLSIMGPPSQYSGNSSTNISQLSFIILQQPTYGSPLHLSLLDEKLI